MIQYKAQKKINEVVADLARQKMLMTTISYRFFDINIKEMYDVKSIDYGEYGIPKNFTVKSTPNDIIKSAGDGICIPSTTMYGKESTDEIYLGDIVRCEFLESTYKDRVVFWDNGWRVIGCTTEEFKMYCPKLVTIVGNIWDNPELYTPYMTHMEMATT